MEVGKYNRLRWKWKGYWYVYDDYDDKVEMDGFRIRFGKKLKRYSFWSWIKKYGLVIMFVLYGFRLIWNIIRYWRMV